MAIQAPKWCGDVVPVHNGWRDAKTGEFMTSAKHSEAQIAEWYEAKNPKAKVSLKKEELVEVSETLTQDEAEQLDEE